MMTEDGRAASGQALVSDGAEGVSTLTGFDPSRLEDAISFASHCHKGQLDKGGQPYILHPLRVMLGLIDEDQRIAAVLHDVVEDCGVEPEIIRAGYGDAVAGAVLALTRRKGEAYTDFIERCGVNEIARAVKRADLCDNMDLSRLPEVSEQDFKRHEKYRAARDRLAAIATEAGTAETETGSVHEGAAIAQEQVPTLKGKEEG